MEDTRDNKTQIIRKEKKMKGIDKIKQFQDLIESRDYFEIAKMLTRIKAEEVLPKEKK